MTGHKPSYGIVSALGQIPGPPGTLSQADLAVAGPLARNVDDLELALDILVGPDPWQAPALRIELPPARRSDPREFRVAAWLDDPACPSGRRPQARSHAQAAWASRAASALCHNAPSPSAETGQGARSLNRNLST